MGDLMSTSDTDTLPIPGPLFGDRIVVRAYTEDDAAAMFEAINESTDHLRPWMAWADSYHTVDDSLEYIRQCTVGFLLRSNFSMGMFLCSDGTYLGGSGIHIGEPQVPSFEIGYWIRASAEGKGYVSEAVRLLTTCAFETFGAERVMIRCDARNDRSRQVAERQGFVFEGRHRNVRRDPAGELIDMLTFAMIPADFALARRHWPDHSV
jgi:RimJ/RimL family protein N-acetyltransferase